MSETLLENTRAVLITSKSLKAARLFKPCTLASLANLSLPCLFCHRFDDEEAILIADVHGDEVHRCVCCVVLGDPGRDDHEGEAMKRALLSVRPFRHLLDSMKCHASITLE